jgi:tetratricopeptide (TPR) repeat protein
MCYLSAKQSGEIATLASFRRSPPAMTMQIYSWLKQAAVLCCLVLVAHLAGISAQDNPPTNPPNSTTTITPFVQAMDLYHQRDLTKASARFKEAAQQGGPEAAASYAWLARLQLMLRQPEDAAASAAKAVQLDKDLPTAQSAMAEVYYRQGKFTEAQEICRRLALTDKPDARAYLVLAKIHWANGNYLSAKQVIDRAYALDPKDPEIFSRWLPTLDAPAQLAELKSRLASAPENSPYHANLKEVVDAREKNAQLPAARCRLVSTATSTEIKLQDILRGPNRLGGYAIPVKLNDGKAMLQVDTGAYGIIVNSRVAQRAGLQKSGNLLVAGIGDNGPSSGYWAKAHTITIGGLQFEDCIVSVADHLRVEDEDGLISTNILEDFLIDLDFPAKAIRLSPLEPLPDVPSPELSLHSGMPIKPNLHNRIVPEKYANFEKVYRIGHDLLIPTQVNDVPPHLFALDTGSWDNTISPALAREAANLSDSNAKVRGLSGNVNNVYRAYDLTLTFGSFRQHRQSLTAFDLKGISDGTGTEISGILGFAMLWILDIKLDYRDNLVDFAVAPNRPH